MFNLNEVCALLQSLTHVQIIFLMTGGHLHHRHGAFIARNARSLGWGMEFSGAKPSFAAYSLKARLSCAVAIDKSADPSTSCQIMMLGTKWPLSLCLGVGG